MILLTIVAATLIDTSAAQQLRDSALQDPSAYAIVSDLTTLFGPRPAGSES